jgi:hypothetical protein
VATGLAVAVGAGVEVAVGRVVDADGGEGVAVGCALLSASSPEHAPVTAAPARMHIKMRSFIVRW